MVRDVNFGDLKPIINNVSVWCGKQIMNLPLILVYGLILMKNSLVSKYWPYRLKT